MKIKLEIQIEFERWCDDKQPEKSKNDWEDFFTNHFMPESSVAGIDDGETQDMIAMSGFNIKCTDIS